MLPAVLLAAVAFQPALAQDTRQAIADRQQDIEMAFDHYTAAKTDDQRAAVIDYLQQLDPRIVTQALVDHIVAAPNGVEATAFDKLVEVFIPEGCEAVINRLAKTDEPVAKGKLIVALRHCRDDDAIHALAGCLDDKRLVPFEARGTHPRRVCDLAYDELFLKLRDDPQYGLDPSPRMQGVITEKIPEKTRDALIASLQAKLAGVASPTPSTPDAAASAAPSP
jgi:hypothetical protein